MFIEAHTHLHSYPDALMPTVLAQIETLPIRTLAVAIDEATYQQTLKLAEASSYIIPTLGIHPWQVGTDPRDLEALLHLLETVLVIGEIGLDFHWITDPATYPHQREVLEFFLAAARDLKKAVNLHTKGAEREILEYLRCYEIKRALIHWYSGDMATFEVLVEDGHYFTMGVELLFSEPIRAMARLLPLSQLLTETDNPGGLPWLCEQHPQLQPHLAGHVTNEHALPSAIIPVYEELAVLKGVSMTELETIVEENFERYLANE